MSKHLGQKSEYIDQYDASLLDRETRAQNREHLDPAIEFKGYDVWNAYEVSGLTNNNLPTAGIAKIIYPASSKYIVESKSLKLYFGSFNMTKLGNTARDVLYNIQKIAQEDLSKLLETEVYVKVFDLDFYNIPKDKMEYITLESTIRDSVMFDTFEEDPSLLKVIDSPSDVVYHSALLRSRCKYTQQQDNGDIYIIIKGDKSICRESLLKYIVSFRSECNFHECIVETVYERLYKLLNPSYLFVGAEYVRRGGIDINPYRASDIEDFIPMNIFVESPSVKTHRQ